MRVLIAGVGYVGVALAHALIAQGHEVFGITRSHARASAFAGENIKPIIADITDPESLAALPGRVDWVANLVSSSKGDAEDYRKIYVEGTSHLLQALEGRGVSKYLQASSTSVYAQDDGQLVDESSPTEPSAPTSQALVEMERLVLQAAREKRFPSSILRISGIYGIGRGHLYRQFVLGEARITGKPERHLNMVHRADIVTAFLAAFERAQPGEIYNVTDDEPVTQLAFYKYFADTLGRPMPPLDENDSPRKRGITDKRVSNAKARRELLWTPQFPTFREGYATFLASTSSR